MAEVTTLAVIDTMAMLALRLRPGNTAYLSVDSGGTCRPANGFLRVIGRPRDTEMRPGSGPFP